MMENELERISAALKSTTDKFGLEDSRAKNLHKTLTVLKEKLEKGMSNVESVQEEMMLLTEIEAIIADSSTKRIWREEEDPEKENIKKKIYTNREKVINETSSLFSILEKNPIVCIRLYNGKMRFAYFASLNPRGSWDIFEDPYTLDCTAHDYRFFTSNEGEWVINSHQNHSADSNWLHEFELMEYHDLTVLVLVIHE
jgi:hypothetical protein